LSLPQDKWPYNIPEKLSVEIHKPAQFATRPLHIQHRFNQPQSTNFLKKLSSLAFAFSNAECFYLRTLGKSFDQRKLVEQPLLSAFE
jgi:hypothetical protein